MKMNYNWDDIEIDDTLTHNSRYFFANGCKHSKHERGNAEQSTSDLDDSGMDNKKVKEYRGSPENKENEENANAFNEQLVSPGLQSRLRSCNISPTKKETTENDQIEDDFAKPDFNEVEIKTEIDEGDGLSVATQMDAPNIESNRNLGKTRNIVTPSRWGKGAISKVPQGSRAPEAYKYQETYEKKRQEALRKKREEERKLREFSSRPAPKFQFKPIKTNLHFVTVCKTPEVLKRSRDFQKKQLAKLEMKELERKSSSSGELSNLKPMPFNLRCEQRLQERKKFDEAFQRSMEEKQKQEEEQRKNEEERHIKEIRKATTFKARPNPFKH